MRRRERRSPRRKRQTLEDPARHARMRDGGDQAHPVGTGRTTRRIDLEDALEELRQSDAMSERLDSFDS